MPGRWGRLSPSSPPAIPTSADTCTPTRADCAPSSTSISTTKTSVTWTRNTPASALATPSPSFLPSPVATPVAVVAVVVDPTLTGKQYPESQFQAEVNYGNLAS